MHNSPEILQADLLSQAAVLLEKLRARCPRVHCVTNTVAQNFTANVLLAMGCVPSMTLSSEEISDFVAHSDGLLINLGTFDRDRCEAIMIAVKTAAHHKLSWVLDPVFVERSTLRQNFARTLIAHGPSVLRLNQTEFTALAGVEPSRDQAMAYARDHRVLLGLSGVTDLVTDGACITAISNGHPLMAKVTAMGCAGSALIAACFAVERDAWLATVTALLIMGIAGERAAIVAKGPGSFAVALLDALYDIDGAVLVQQARIS